jgi:hypothetical protein
MVKHNQNGAAAGVGLAFAMLIILLIAAISFGAWAYSGRSTSTSNVASKVAVAVAAAKQQQQSVDSAQYAQEAQLPLRAFDGPEQYGSLIVSFPKDWSAYVDSTGQGAALLDGYFAPGTVPAIEGTTSVFALRVQVQNQPYSQTVANFASDETAGQFTAAAYALPKVPQAVGLEITGTLADGNTGTMVILPLRSYTLEIWTEGTQYLSDFNNIILPNFSFSP